MYNYVPQSGTIPIPLWVFREFKTLFIVPETVLRRFSLPLRTKTGTIAYLDDNVLDDETDINLNLTLGLIVQLTLDGHHEAQSPGNYKVEPLLDQVMIQCFNDKYDNCTWYFRAETLVIRHVPDVE